ncbi:hypothetical protein LLS1_00230 [Leifsonia sp. LS1]|nr:hypothetical protein LLS1_00230 [Leifsonia sp. LS1]
MNGIVEVVTACARVESSSREAQLSRRFEILSMVLSSLVKGAAGAAHASRTVTAHREEAPVLEGTGAAASGRMRSLQSPSGLERPVSALFALQLQAELARHDCISSPVG